MQPLQPNETFAKIALKSLSVSIRIALFLTFHFAIVYNIQAQGDSIATEFNDSIQQRLQPSDLQELDTNIIVKDTASISENLAVDSLSADSLRASSKPKQSALEDKVVYNAKDSMKISLVEETMYLYGEASVKYMDIELKADYIELNYTKEEVFAKGSLDTAGNVIGKPVFNQGSQNFESDSIKYNFNTENGIIYHIVTQQGEGYLHSEKSRRHENGHIHAYGNKYTTCDAEHPHFYLALNKAIIIPEDKIIAGPSYFVVQDIPIKILGLPFGFFPNTTNRSSGLLFPTYGEDRQRGFYLLDLGWYQVLGDYADFRILGDFYSKGSWGMESTLSYKRRYYYGGNFSFNYNINKNNDDATFLENKGYRILWSHRQDAKANPTQNFSANVNFSSSNYEKYNSYDPYEYTQNQKSSSISFTKNWPGTPFSLALSANANNNSQSKTVTMNLPTGSFNMNSIYPFRRKTGSGKYKWYENVNIRYTSKFDNQIFTYDTIVFSQQTLDTMKYGFRHDIPLSVNFKIGNLITVTPSLNYSGILNSGYSVMDSTVYIDGVGVVQYTHHVKELTYAHAINPSIGVSFAPKLYGMYASTKEDGYIKAVRHVLSPSAGFSFTPDMNKFNRNYYDSVHYINSEGERIYYGLFNPFKNEVNSSPPSSSGRSGSVSLSLNNNLEMKVRPKNDTADEAKKVVILENLRFSTSYSPFAESFKWADVSMTTGTKLFKRKLSIQLNGSFSPYADLGNDTITNKRIEKFYYKTQNGINFLRPTRFSVSSSFTLKSHAGKKGSDEANQQNTDVSTNEEEFVGSELDFNPSGYSGQYVDFDIPWSLSFRHSWSWNRASSRTTRTNSVSVNGDFSLTPKWKIGVVTGYDFEAKRITSTKLNIHRDLHCWQMSFSVIPFGQRASYSFTIQAKSSLLRDLKYEKKPNYYDNY